MGRTLGERTKKKRGREKEILAVINSPFFSPLLPTLVGATGETPARTPPGHRPLSSPTLFYPYLVLDHAVIPTQTALGLCLYALCGHRY